MYDALLHVLTKIVTCIIFVLVLFHTVQNGVDDLRTTCKAALLAYDPTNVLVRSRAAHHPFAFPRTSSMGSDFDLPPVARVSRKMSIRISPRWPPTSNTRCLPRLTLLASPRANSSSTTAASPVRMILPMAMILSTSDRTTPPGQARLPSMFFRSTRKVKSVGSPSTTSTRRVPRPAGRWTALLMCSMSA